MHQYPYIILFACVHNAGRSQIAAALLNKLGNPDKVRAISAGTQPAERIHPVVLAALHEVGIAPLGLVPQRLTAALAASANRLITMGCGETCPIVPGIPREDWPLPDPKDLPIEQVRAIRDEIRVRVEQLLIELQAL